jgi:hypothetical protein
VDPAERALGGSGHAELEEEDGRGTGQNGETRSLQLQDGKGGHWGGLDSGQPGPGPAGPGPGQPMYRGQQQEQAAAGMDPEPGALGGSRRLPSQAPNAMDLPAPETRL